MPHHRASWIPIQATIPSIFTRFRQWQLRSSRPWPGIPGRPTRRHGGLPGPMAMTCYAQDVPREMRWNLSRNACVPTEPIRLGVARVHRAGETPAVHTASPRASEGHCWASGSTREG